MAKTIVVVGSCMIDFVCYAPRLPKEGETIHGTKFATNFGGKGANQCVAASRLGGKTTMIARVGDDIWGDKYIRNFKDVGVDCRHVRNTPGHSNGIAQITVADSGNNQIVIVAGANLQLNVEDLNLAKKEIEDAAVVVCQLETAIEVAMLSVQLCKGISILNGAPALSEYEDELIISPSIFCINETEASIFTGLTVGTVDDAKVAIEHLLRKGCKCVIITMGAQGAVFASQKEPISTHVPCPEVVCVDSTGAGDAFIGALAFLLANRADLALKEVIAAACVVASNCCGRPGTQNSYENSSVLDTYLRENLRK